MNVLPINKIFLAGFAFTFMHWKKIVEISIIPLLLSVPFLLLVPELLDLAVQMFEDKNITNVLLPDNMMIYLIGFFYGYLSLSIKLYRLVLSGGVSKNNLMPIMDFRVMGRFAGLSLLIGMMTIFPALITGISFLQVVVSFLIVPITLNFVNIALNQPSKYRWHLPFSTHLNLFFLQVVLPALAVILFSILDNAIGLDSALVWIIRAVLFYWTSITLVLCYQLLHTQDTSKHH